MRFFNLYSFFSFIRPPLLSSYLLGFAGSSRCPCDSEGNCAGSPDERVGTQSRAGAWEPGLGQGLWWEVVGHEPRCVNILSHILNQKRKEASKQTL